MKADKKIREDNTFVGRPTWVDKNLIQLHQSEESKAIHHGVPIPPRSSWLRVIFYSFLKNISQLVILMVFQFEICVYSRCVFYHLRKQRPLKNFHQPQLMASIFYTPQGPFEEMDGGYMYCWWAEPSGKKKTEPQKRHPCDCRFSISSRMDAIKGAFDRTEEWGASWWNGGGIHSLGLGGNTLNLHPEI